MLMENISFKCTYLASTDAVSNGCFLLSQVFLVAPVTSVFIAGILFQCTICNFLNST